MTQQEWINFIIEIFFFAAAIYFVLRFLRSTRGSGIVRGLVIISVILALGLVTLFNTQELPRLEYVFKSIVEIVILALVILFAPELRRGITRLGEHPLLQRLSRAAESRILGEVALAAERLSKDRTGALMALERDTPLDSIIEEGVKLDARCHHLVLESLFHPGGALHDGAVIIRGERIAAASCVLPLSESSDIPRRLGTRHRAAIGLTEGTDSVALVVSEETGQISICTRGEIRTGIPPGEVEQALKASFVQAGEKTAPAPASA